MPQPCLQTMIARDNQYSLLQTFVHYDHNVYNIVHDVSDAGTSHSPDVRLREQDPRRHQSASTDVHGPADAGEAARWRGNAEKGSRKF